jgi:hypothetical protein
MTYNNRTKKDHQGDCAIETDVIAEKLHGTMRGVNPDGSTKALAEWQRDPNLRKDPLPPEKKPPPP